MAAAVALVEVPLRRTTRPRRTLRPTRPECTGTVDLRGIAGHLIAFIEHGELVHHDPSAVSPRMRSPDEERERDSG